MGRADRSKSLAFDVTGARREALTESEAEAQYHATHRRLHPGDACLLSRDVSVNRPDVTGIHVSRRALNCTEDPEQSKLGEWVAQ